MDFAVETICLRGNSVIKNFRQTAEVNLHIHLVQFVFSTLGATMSTSGGYLDFIGEYHDSCGGAT